MASIATYLQKILAAVYGEEVRGSIHDAISAMNDESTQAMQYAATAQDSARASATAAASSASTASTKASNASSSASAAANSALDAAGSASNAANSASDAAASASAAATSEQNAGNSALLAGQHASNASSSESAAAASAANAANSESATETLKSDVETLKGNVETLATQAASDKNAAVSAKASAEAARDAALISETNAAYSESTVLAAQSVVVTAKTDAEAASAAAQAAKNAAQAAQTAAETSENSARTYADSAAASATSAQQYSGNPPRPDTTTNTWWIWNAATQQYEDSHIASQIAGPQGTGVDDIRLTSGDHTPGTADVYTVYLTDGGSYNISVWNGHNGTGAGDVLGKSFDLLIPVSGWSDGRITIANAQLIALSTHKYLIGPNEASREEYLNCEVRALDITTDGFITFVSATTPAEDLTVNVLRLELSANG